MHRHIPSLKEFLFVTLCIPFVSCTTTTHLPISSDVTSPDPVQVVASPEPYGLRVDLIRVDQSTDRTYQARKASNTSFDGPSLHSYAPLGIDLGNGLFYDTNGNLSVDLARLLQWKIPFTVAERVMTTLPYTVSYTWKGDEFRRTGGSRDLPDMQVKKQDDAISFSGDVTAYAGTLLVTDNGYSFAPNGITLTDRVELKQRNSKSVESPRMMGSDLYLQTNESTVDLRGQILVSRTDNEIIITPTSGLFGPSAPFRFQKTTNGCRFLDPRGVLTEIRSQGNQVTVTVSGKVTQVYTYTQGAS